MTAWELFSNVMTLMFGTDEEMDEYQDYYVNTLNLILAELFDLNNALRIGDGRKPLKNIPECPKYDSSAPDKAKNFEIPYEPKVVRTVLPYGVAGYIYVDDDKAIGTDYKNKYEYAKTQIFQVAFVDIVDVYTDFDTKEEVLADDEWSLAENG